jgi:hypothetical protein
MSKAVKRAKRAVSKVVSGVGKVIKKVTSSKVFKAIAIAAAVYFTGGAALGAMGAASAGTSITAGFASGLGSAWGGIAGAGTALMSGSLSGIGSSLAGGITGAYGAGAASGAAGSLMAAFQSGVTGAAPSITSAAAGASSAVAPTAAVPTASGAYGPMQAGYAGATPVASSAGAGTGIGGQVAQAAQVGVPGSGLLQKPGAAPSAMPSGMTDYASQSLADLKKIDLNSLPVSEVLEIKKAVGDDIYKVLTEASTQKPGLLRSFVSNPLVQYSALNTAGNMKQGYAAARGEEKAEEDLRARYKQNLGTPLWQSRH